MWLEQWLHSLLAVSFPCFHTWLAGCQLHIWFCFLSTGSWALYPTLYIVVISWFQGPLDPVLHTVSSFLVLTIIKFFCFPGWSCCSHPFIFATNLPGCSDPGYRCSLAVIATPAFHLWRIFNFSVPFYGLFLETTKSSSRCRMEITA